MKKTLGALVQFSENIEYIVQLKSSSVWKQRQDVQYHNIFLLFSTAKIIFSRA